MKRCVILVLMVLLARSAPAESPSSLRRDDLIYAPQPAYPYDARRRELQGSGMFILRVRPDGAVARVDVQDSTGAPLLDQVTIAAYSKWRFKPGKSKSVRVPVHFTMAPYPYTPHYVPPKSR